MGEMICKVGNDKVGTNIINNLRDNGVIVDNVLCDDEESSVNDGGSSSISSGVAMISVEESTGDNSIVVHPGANAKLSVNDIKEIFNKRKNKQIDNKKKRGVVLSQLEIPIETAMEALKLGRENGYITILNPAPAPSHELLPREIYNYIDIIIPNQIEILSLLQDDEEEKSLNNDDIDKYRIAIQKFMNKKLLSINKYINY